MISTMRKSHMKKQCFSEVLNNRPIIFIGMKYEPLLCIFFSSLLLEKNHGRVMIKSNTRVSNAKST